MFKKLTALKLWGSNFNPYTAKFVKWTGFSLSLAHSVVSLREIKIEMLWKAGSSIEIDISDLWCEG